MKHKNEEFKSDLEQKNYMIDELKKQLDEMIQTRDLQVSLVMSKQANKFISKSTTTTKCKNDIQAFAEKID